MKFDDIELIDDRAEPKFDPNLGLDSEKNAKAEDGTSVNEWGKGWGSGGGGSSWGITTAAGKPEEPAADPDWGWGFNSSKDVKKKMKKKKGKKFTSDFKWDEPELPTPASTGEPKTPAEEKQAEDIVWANFSTKNNRKKTKGSGSAIDDTELPPPANEVNLETPAEDKQDGDIVWADFSTKKNKKKNKEGKDKDSAGEPEPSDEAGQPPPKPQDSSGEEV